MPVIRNFSRLIVGIVFIYSGFVKGIDPLGSMYKFIEYFNAAGLGNLDTLALIAAFALALAEFVIGLALLFNLRPRVASPVALLFMLLFTPLTLYLAFANPVNDCGCFGDALKLTHWQSFWKNVVLLGLAGIVHVNRGRYNTSLSPARQGGLLSLLGLGMFGLSLYSYSTLPVLDFSPYAVGKNIQEGMKTPDEAELNQYEVTLFYKHLTSGEIKAFTDENYPWQDSSWVYERTERKLLKRGYIPPIHDFFIEHPLEGEITREVLEANDYTLLVVARDLEGLPREMQARINRLAYYLQGRGYHVLGLTSASEESARAFRERYRVPYVICSSDDTQLKTMIRSTPGLLLLHGGTIIAKWPGGGIPEVAALEGGDLVAFSIRRARENRESLLLFTFLFFLSTAYLLFLPSRRKRRR
ncbi:MAG: DoxX family protein [Odoribacteraceae bacterium]|jgi:uncharacterized membrane protein YphA (DoxX/SURF4 family)|nr:DoxX family protein [Odoribacteraceae bacterium]